MRSQIFSKKTPTSVSLRTLVEVGSGRRRFVSSIRDVLSLRDALGSLNDRISTHNLSLSLREVSRAGPCCERDQLHGLKI